MIYGDYDVDGITATAILWHAINLLGGNVDFYVPHRIEEGYGLNAEALRRSATAGRSSIITVDCGITAVEPASVARELGVDLIITDHHEWHCGESPDGHSPGDPILPPALRWCILGCRAFAGVWQPLSLRRGRRVQIGLGAGPGDDGQPRVSEWFRAFLVEARRWRRWGPSPTSCRSLARIGRSCISDWEI